MIAAQSSMLYQMTMKRFFIVKSNGAVVECEWEYVCVCVGELPRLSRIYFLIKSNFYAYYRQSGNLMELN